MGLFNGTNVSVEAILTTRGRELLSKDSGKLNITKFALGDEEIDYTLYDTTHPNGDVSFGTVIENSIPIEATPTRQNLRSYLVTIDKSFHNKKLIVPQDVTLQPDTLFIIEPITRNGGVEVSENYLFTIQNINIITFVNEEDNKNITKTFTGKKITVNSNRINPGATTTITVRGVDSNLTKTVVVTVEADTINQTISPFDGSVVVTDNRYY
jgi:hypothetical protein